MQFLRYAYPAQYVAEADSSVMPRLTHYDSRSKEVQVSACGRERKLNGVRFVCGGILADWHIGVAHGRRDGYLDR